MTFLFLDTSALVKLYVHERGTDALLRLAHPDTGNKTAILSLTRIEFRAAVRRRAKLGDLDTETANALLTTFTAHLSALYVVQPVNEAVLEAAAGMVDRHTLRAYDAIQLAGCASLRATLGEDVSLTFVCADETLLQAARSEGLTSLNPAT